MQDNELMRILYQNPDIGLGYVIEQYGGLVYCIIKSKLSVIGTQEDIQECVSDVFMEFYQQREQLDLSRGSVKAYLAVMAKRRGIDCYRRLARSLDYQIDAGAEWENLKDAKTNLEQDMMNKEQKRCLLLAIDSLGEPDREIFIRKYYMGQKTKQIADALCLRDNTVDKKISRGLKKLRRWLGGVAYENESSIFAKGR